MRRIALLTAATAVLFALTGWVAARSLLPVHLSRVIGRSDVEVSSCRYCHRKVSAPPLRGSGATRRFVSPAGLAVSPDGAHLYVAASGTDRLLEIDLEGRRVESSIEIAGGPHGVAVSPDGRRIAVTSRDGNRVVVVDSVALQRVAEFEAPEPLGVAFSTAGQLWVAGSATDELLLFSPGSVEGVLGLSAGNEPYAVALAEVPGLVAVANRLARPVGPGVEPVSELTIVDADLRRVVERRELRSAHLSEGVALSPDGSFALASAIRVRNLLPLTQVARGGVMTSALVLADLRPGGATVQFPLDEVNAFYADPSGVVLTPDGLRAFVAHGGARAVTAVDVRAMLALLAAGGPAELDALADDLGASVDYVLARIPTRDNPRGLALSPDGTRLYVAERLADSVAVIDTRELRVIDRIELGEPGRPTPERRGERVFHDASTTFQGQFSCRSCHPDGHTDGLVWDFEIDGPGRNLLETRSLRGIRATAPFKWSGKNPTLHVQCGPRFARVLTRSDPFSEQQLDDLVAFVESLGLPPNRLGAEFADAADRGRELFVRVRDNNGKPIPTAQRCNTCHRPPLFTDRLKSDVGTGGLFDTPHLFDIASSPPYLHDGRSATLEEIWTVHSPEDTHGVTSDLTKAELNDLVVYLRSL